jgi:hypothetical protein
MISDLLIREEELELVLVVDVLNHQGVEVDGAVVHWLGELVDCRGEQWDFVAAAKSRSVIQIFNQCLKVPTEHLGLILHFHY